MTRDLRDPRTVGTLRPRLEGDHARWRAEVGAVLGPARHPEAGTWARWTALHYLQTVFPARVEQERRMVQRLEARLTGEQRTSLWALGELLDVLPEHLGHLIGLCHRAQQFAGVTGRLQSALDRWCRAVEDSCGPLPASALTAGRRVTGGRAAPRPVAHGG